jgi:putative hydrolase of the HAD superfamily
MKYRYVWFDLGCTLVHSDHAGRYAEALREFGVHRDEAAVEAAFYLADKTFMRQYPHVLGGNPDTFLPWYLGVLNYHLGVKLNLHACQKSYVDTFTPDGRRWTAAPGAADLLRRLKAAGLGVGLISNWDLSCRTVLSENGLDWLLDVIVVSGEAGFEKPDPRIFQIALQAAGVTPEHSLYVGDNYYDDVLGARAAGMDCLLLAPYGRTGIEEIAHDRLIAEIGEVDQALA